MSQSLEGNKSITRITVQEPILYDPEHVDVVNDFPVPIINNYVIIKVGHGATALYVKQKVVRVRNQGATNTIKKPNPIHLEIINWFRSREIRAKYSYDYIVNDINQKRSSQGLRKYAPSTIQGRISELQFRRILELIVESGKHYFVLDRAMTEKVLREGKFS